MSNPEIKPPASLAELVTEFCQLTEIKAACVKPVHTDGKLDLDKSLEALRRAFQIFADMQEQAKRDYAYSLAARLAAGDPRIVLSYPARTESPASALESVSGPSDARIGKLAVLTELLESIQPEEGESIQEAQIKRYTVLFLQRAIQKL